MEACFIYISNFQSIFIIDSGRIRKVEQKLILRWATMKLVLTFNELIDFMVNSFMEMNEQICIKCWYVLQKFTRVCLTKDKIKISLREFFFHKIEIQLKGFLQSLNFMWRSIHFRMYIVYWIHSEFMTSSWRMQWQEIWTRMW